jgi:nucleotide-binding universal stress UspA family protein
MFARILLAWDGSEVSLRAYDAAIDLTRRYDAELVAVSIAYSPSHTETSADREESVGAARRYLEETFGELRDRAERAGVGVVHEIIEGASPAEALLRHAHEHGFDVIVCGHHHSRRIGRLLLHGVAEALLAEGTIPLLIVSDPER